MKYFLLYLCALFETLQIFFTCSEDVHACFACMSNNCYSLLALFFHQKAIILCRQWVLCIINSLYIFTPTVLKLYVCFLHEVKMCVWFFYAVFVTFLPFCSFVNLVFFPFFSGRGVGWGGGFVGGAKMLLYCMDCGYFVKSTSLAVSNGLVSNFADGCYMNFQ